MAGAATGCATGCATAATGTAAGAATGTAAVAAGAGVVVVVELALSSSPMVFTLNYRSQQCGCTGRSWGFQQTR
ncbi:MAG: hypothetical protein DWC11_07400 [Candidatus Poseidoniales archaeon]|nr:MAG: hypothetical protein DWC11_07400 [Candidatus Poseidoniales archaeon]